MCTPAPLESAPVTVVHSVAYNSCNSRIEFYFSNFFATLHNQLLVAEVDTHPASAAHSNGVFLHVQEQLHIFCCSIILLLSLEVLCLSNGLHQLWYIEKPSYERKVHCTLKAEAQHPTFPVKLWTTP